jgi:hypothetical protein
MCARRDECCRGLGTRVAQLVPEGGTPVITSQGEGVAVNIPGEDLAVLEAR